VRAEVGSEHTAPVFVGGTGRSGTTILAQLIGSHSRYAFIPSEFRVHAEAQGLPAFVKGNLDASGLEALMERYWSYELEHPRGGSRGLSSLVSRKELDDAVERFLPRAAENPEVAARVFVHDLLDPIAHRAGKPSWVEMTPINIMQGALLSSVLPDAKFLHIMRDGRDTVCSLVARNWLPSIEDAIEWWGPRRTKTLLGAASIPADRVHTLTLEDLIRDDRDATYQGLLDFLAIDDEPEMRSFFDTGMRSAERAHIGRWQRELDPETQARLSERHEELERHAQLVLARKRAGRASRGGPEQDDDEEGERAAPFVLLGADEATTEEVARVLAAAGAPLTGPDGLELTLVEPRIWIDPENVATEVDALYPGTPVVLVARDPVQVLRAQVREPLEDWISGLLDDDGRPEAETGVRYGSASRGLMSIWGERLLVVVYEDLLDSPMTTLSRVAGHTGVELDLMAEPPEAAPGDVPDAPQEALPRGTHALLYERVCRAEVEELEEATGLAIRSWRPFLVS
jgi:sulfotransferase family protein